MTGLDHALGTRVVVRVLDAAGEVVGGGFFVGPDLVATCAHVVATAIGADPYAAQAPGGRVRIDVPLFRDPATEQPPSISAEITRWVPIGDDGTGDIAVLRLDGPAPEGTRMPPLRRVDQLWGHTFRVLGFPAGMTDGVWATGAFRGQQGTRWFQLQAAVGEQPIVEGFSGAPVWDEGSGAVVGMTVATDHSGQTTTAYLIPIDQVLGVDPDLLPCPYRGLEPFGEEHASYFFGRDAAIDQLVETVASKPLVAVTGPSGAGKSSLVRAGLMPRLRRQGHTVAELLPRIGQSPADVLQEVLATVPAERTAPLVLVVDQFEELAATQPQAAQELLGRLGELASVDADAPVRVVLTMRSATLDEMLVPGIAELLSTGTVLLAPMERGQLRSAIVAPAERAPGLSFEPGLVDRILDDAAAEPGQLPLVESLLTELWERRAGGNLTLDAYEQAGGVAGVVATHAEQVVARFTDPADGPRLRRLFTSLARPDREGRFLRSPVLFNDLAADLLPLLSELVAGRLLVVEKAGGERTVQLAHQALIAHWPRLHGWLSEDRDFLDWRAQLDVQRERWESSARDEGALLRGTALAAAQEWLPTRADDVAPASRDYVRRSRARQRREVRRWRVVTAVLAVLVLAAGALSVVTVVSRNQIGEQLRLANADRMAQTALANEYGDPATATALALTAWHADPENGAARTAMLRQSLAMRSVEQVFPAVAKGSLVTISPSADGNVVLVRDGPGMVVHTGARGAALQRWEPPGQPPDLARTFVDHEGKRLIVSTLSGSVLTWDIGSTSEPKRLAAAGGWIDSASVSLSPDGTRLSWLAGRPDPGRRLVIWDIARDAEIPNEVPPITDPDMGNLVESGDPGVVIQFAAGGTPSAPVRLSSSRSLLDGRTLATFPPGAETVELGGKFGFMACAAGAPARAAVYDVTTGAEVRQIPLLTQTCSTDYLARTLTSDNGYLMEPRTSDRDRDSDVYRLTAIADGRTYDLTTPPSSNGPPTERPQSNVTQVVGRDQDRPVVLLPRAAAVLRLRATPDSGGTVASTPLAIGMSADGRYQVTIHDDEYAVLETGTAKVVGRLNRSQLRDAGGYFATVGTNTLIIRVQSQTQWSFSEYALPTLKPLESFVIPHRPGRGGETPTDVGIDITDERVATSANGLLTVWDRRTGVPVGPPVQLGTTPDRADFFATGRHIALRDEPNGSAVVAAPDGTIEVWDPATGAQVDSFRLPSSTAPTEMLIDGNRLVVEGLDFGVQVWDLDRKAPAGEPFLLPSLGLLKGFTADGKLAFLMENGNSGYMLTLRDPVTGRDAGTLPGSAALDIGSSYPIDGNRIPFYGIGGALPVMLPLTPQAWRDQLCGISDRPLTPAERALIPEGTDAERPCP
ncbi:nSTAND1 domain-containing NTPase [Pseudonocardia sp. TRM90224]|uniref:nSTAND1 domain-containing NTPase n=1 Tax=Pseudonocardia sp. TRM90224 TaxID=2812678 RepID=UPI001E425794|nr:trypsin-like peptidase domain-containing protein [Pseudonocardia sp. TRM90224]